MFPTYITHRIKHYNDTFSTYSLYIHNIIMENIQFWKMGGDRSSGFCVESSSLYQTLAATKEKISPKNVIRQAIENCARGLSIDRGSLFIVMDPITLNFFTRAIHIHLSHSQTVRWVVASCAVAITSCARKPSTSVTFVTVTARLTLSMRHIMGPLMRK
jgi:hypothetical protein